MEIESMFNSFNNNNNDDVGIFLNLESPRLNEKDKLNDLF